MQETPEPKTEAAPPKKTVGKGAPEEETGRPEDRRPQEDHREEAGAEVGPSSITPESLGFLRTVS